MENYSGAVLCHTIILLATSLFILKKRKVLKNGIKKRWHVRPINQNREKYGMFETTYHVMRRYDPEEFYKYTRMSTELFDDLCNKVRHDPLMRREYRVREPVSVEERVAITLE